MILGIPRSGDSFALTSLMALIVSIRELEGRVDLHALTSLMALIVGRILA